MQNGPRKIEQTATTGPYAVRWTKVAAGSKKGAPEDSADARRANTTRAHPDADCGPGRAE